MARPAGSRRRSSSQVLVGDGFGWRCALVESDIAMSGCLSAEGAVHGFGGFGGTVGRESGGQFGGKLNSAVERDCPDCRPSWRSRSGR